MDRRSSVKSLLLALAGLGVFACGDGHRRRLPVPDTADGQDIDRVPGLDVWNGEGIAHIAISAELGGSILTMGDCFAMGHAGATVFGCALADESKGEVAWFLVENQAREQRFASRSDLNEELRRRGPGVPVLLPLVARWPTWSSLARDWMVDDRLLSVTTLSADPPSQGLTGGYRCFDVLSTFLVIASPPFVPKGSQGSRPDSARIENWLGDVVQIGWDDRFIVAEECFYVRVPDAWPLPDLAISPAFLIIDTNSGKTSRGLDVASFRALRADLGVPESVVLRDVAEVWPEWSAWHRDWRGKAEYSRALGVR
jgi:hypothetical protein